MRASRELPLTTVEEADRYRRSGAWPDETVYERFERIAMQYGDKTATIEADRTLTYSQLLERVRALSRGLLDAGIGKGDVVAVQLPNSAEQPIAHLALNRIGALAMPVHESWTEAELPHLLIESKAVAAIVRSSYKQLDYPALYATLKPQLPALRQVFAIGAPASQAESFEVLLSRGSEKAVAELGRIDPDEPADLMLSSGTTSMPKISVYSSNGLFALLQPFWRRLKVTPNDVAAALAPAGTGAIGYVYPILTPLLHGATAVILERWGDPAAAVDLIVRHKCTYATGVPAQLTQMLPAISQRPVGDFSAFRCFTNAGAPLPPDIGREVETKMDCKIFVIYGATDGGVACCSSLEDTQDQRLASVGWPQEECEIRLMDEAGKPLPPGPHQTGEIQWRCADKSYGYLNDPEATAMAFTSDRFYRTGDLGSFDADGRLRIVGRVKDMIIRGGRNISPRLIEEVVQRHPQVLEVAVAAYPDKVLGERACAFVVLRPGVSGMSLQSLVDFLRTQQMSTWQMPERLELMDELPKSAGGKVMKNKLREYVAGKVQAEQVAQAA